MFEFLCVLIVYVIRSGPVPQASTFDGGKRRTCRSEAVTGVSFVSILAPHVSTSFGVPLGLGMPALWMCKMPVQGANLFPQAKQKPELAKRAMYQTKTQEAPEGRKVET